MHTPSRPSSALVLLTLALPATAQTRKLNGPLAREAIGQFLGVQVSTSTARLAYSADTDGNGSFALRSVQLDGGEAARELVPAPAGFPLLTRDGKQVLFTADLDGNGALELAVVPLDGSAPARSLASADPGEDIVDVEASLDLEHVLFLRSVQLTFPPFDPVTFAQTLHSVSLLGTPAPVRLDGPLVAGGSVVRFALAPDGLTLVYQADQEQDGVRELFVVPVDGSAPAHKLPIPLVTAGNTVFFQFDADGTHVLYTADAEQNERYELYSIASDGSGAPLKLSQPLVAGGAVGEPLDGQLNPFQRSFDGRWIAYVADAEVNDRFELYRVAVDGSTAPLKLSLPINDRVHLQVLSYDSAWAVYTSRQGPALRREVFSAPLDGSAPARSLSGPMPNGGDAFLPQISFDSLLVVYGADQEESGIHELWGAPIDGSAPSLRLNGPFQPGSDLDTSLGNLLPGFWVMTDGVMYQADQEQDERVELYFAPFPLGTLAYKLAAGPLTDAFPAALELTNPPADLGAVVFQRQGKLESVRVAPNASPRALDALPNSAIVGDVERLALTPDGTRAQYIAREEGDLSRALYSVATGERSQTVQLHPEGAILGSTVLSPDGRWAVFELGFEPVGLYSALADGTGVPHLLFPDQGDDLVFTPDGEQLLFRSGGGLRQLYAVHLDGSAPATFLSGAIPPSPAVVAGLRSSADSRWVAFRTSESKLYVAPVDGRLPAVQVSANGQSVIDDFELSPDGGLVFYRTDGAGVRQGELFVAPRDASQIPLRLNGSLVGFGDVLAFEVTPDGTRVVYLASAVVGRQELFTVPTDGSPPAVRLHAPLGALADVLDFQLAPDGTHVVYRADALVDEHFQLFGVPADASRAPVRVGESPLPAGDVLEYAVSPDSRTVVYRADALPGSVALFRAPILGSRGSRRIGQAPFAGGRVVSFQISADSRTVAFAAERNAQHDLTLLVGSIDGEAQAKELAGPFAGRGSVFEYALSADGTLAAWRADQEEPGVTELFAAPTGRRSAVPAGNTSRDTIHLR